MTWLFRLLLLFTFDIFLGVYLRSRLFGRDWLHLSLPSLKLLRLSLGFGLFLRGFVTLPELEPAMVLIIFVFVRLAPAGLGRRQRAEQRYTVQDPGRF